MSKAVIQSTVLNNGTALTIAANADVEIRVASSGALATLFEDRAGATGKANPFTADSDGFFKVYATSDRYNITVTTADGALTFNDVVAFNAEDYPNASGIAFGRELITEDVTSIQLGSSSTILSNFGNNAYLLNNAYQSSGYKYVGAGFAQAYLMTSTGSHQFRQAASGSADAGITWVTSSQISPNGYTKMADDGAPISDTGDYHEFVQSDSASPTNRALTVWHKATTGNNVFEEFFTEASATLRGSIDYNRGGGLVRYNTTSDARLKNILGKADLLKCKSLVLGCKLRSYAWKHDEEQKPQIGVIAQEELEHFPGSVSKGENEWSVDKTAYVWHLVGTCQHQQKEIDSLKKENTGLKLALKSITDRLESLENNTKG